MAASAVFEPMTEADLDWVVAREAELHPFPWSRGNFADSLAAGHSCWLMWSLGQPLAYAVMLIVLDEAHLLDISVDRAAQGKGVGRKMVDHLRQEARNNGATQLFLEVRPSNLRAIALYRNIGFEQIGRRRDYYPAVGGREDALVMRVGL